MRMRKGESKIRREMKLRTHRGVNVGTKYQKNIFLCGVKRGFYTFSPRKVTCKNCKRIMRIRRKLRRKYSRG